MAEHHAQAKHPESPSELKTESFIRIRGRIIGAPRLSKKAGILAIAVLVVLVSAIVFGVTQNGPHGHDARPRAVIPTQPAQTTPWWQRESDVSKGTRLPPISSAKVSVLPPGVPDLSRLVPTSPEAPAPQLPSLAPVPRLNDGADEGTRIPRVLTLDAQTNDYVRPAAGASVIRPKNESISAAGESSADEVRHAAMASAPLVDVRGTRAALQTSAQSSAGGVDSGDNSQMAPANSPTNGSPTKVADSARVSLASTFELQTGTIIPASLVTAIDSDLPGLLIAQVRENTYDTLTGRFVLIPLGAKLIGAYDARIAFGQERILVTWSRVVFPDGSTLELNSMAGTDLAGRSGFDARVDNHTRTLFQGAILMSIIGAGAQLGQPPPISNGSAPTVRQIVAGTVGTEIASTSTQLTQRRLNVPPNLRVPTGYQFDVMVDHDIVFSGPYVGP